MIFDLIKNNKTLRELLYGITVFGIICEVIILILTKNRLYNSIGLIMGIVISLGCAVHMAWGIDIAVNLDEKSAIAFTRKYTVIRYLVMCVALAVIGLLDIGSPVTLIFGYMGLKFGAYLNPLIHKITSGEEEKTPVEDVLEEKTLDEKAFQENVVEAENNLIENNTTENNTTENNTTDNNSIEINTIDNNTVENKGDNK